MKYLQPLILTSSLLLLASCANFNVPVANTNSTIAYNYLKDLASPTEGIGAREAGSIKEKQTASYIKAKFESFGYNVIQQDFSYNSRKKESAAFS